ncbi:unannotated protein [freshwater metagenome]|uniref:Unannotated protein n=1 Tax=freshwater metagenome TaxID=449393 RepID=A0A6J6XPN5_9ZZZZ
MVGLVTTRGAWIARTKPAAGFTGGADGTMVNATVLSLATL